MAPEWTWARDQDQQSDARVVFVRYVCAYDLTVVAANVLSKGAHSCIGKVLAYHQMRLALARLLLAFDFELQKGFDVAGFRSGILNMRTMFLEKELYVKVTRRPGVDLDVLADAVA